jgi:hypothetical protein
VLVFCTQTAPILITQRLYPLLQAANSVRGSKEGAAAGKVFNISSPLGELLPLAHASVRWAMPCCLTCSSDLASAFGL